MPLIGPDSSAATEMIPGRLWLGGIRAALDEKFLTENNITVSVAANPTLNTSCTNASGAVWGLTIMFQSALIQGFNVTNTFGLLEFDYTGSNTQESGSAIIHPAYYVFNGSTRVLTTRITGAPLRNFNVDVDVTTVYQNNTAALFFGSTGFSINTLSNSCHTVYVNAITFFNNTTTAQSLFNSYLSANGGGNCAIQVVDSDTYRVT